MHWVMSAPVGLFPQGKMGNQAKVLLLVVSPQPIKYVVAPGVRGFSDWGKFLMNPVKPEEDKGKGRLG